MRNAALFVLAGTLLQPAILRADGICVEADGRYVDSCLLTEDCQVPTPEPAEQQELAARARRMANAGCTDNPVFSSLKLYAFRDATKIEITTVRTAIWTSATEAQARQLLSQFAISIRPGEPVIIRIAPVRLGNPDPIIVAKVTGAPEKPEVEFLVHPTWPKAKP